MYKKWYELVNWEDVRADMQYPKEDNNNGLIFGVHIIEDCDIVEIYWFKAERERSEFVAKEYKGYKKLG
jgi:hypothetical protein